MTRLFGGALLMVAVSSCLLPGAPEPGGACSYGVDIPECMTPKSIGVCGEDDQWHERKCRRCSNQQPVKCTQAVGDTCLADEGYCVDSTTQMFCNNGKFATKTCETCEQSGSVSDCRQPAP